MGEGQITDPIVAHFEIHPSVIYQLGESLISDPVQALIELVKNCYDADARYAKVTVDTTGFTMTGEEGGASSGVARIVIEDDGCGMTQDDIINGWLVISNRKKGELKRNKVTTPGGRTPLGDKGLGRLGAQRLGTQLELLTRAAGGQGWRLAFSWLDFATAPSLSRVDIELKPYEFPKHHGTTVIISDLKEPELWRGSEATNRLQNELSKMISPYKEIRDFNIYFEVAGKDVPLRDISEQIRDLAHVRYHLRFDGTALTATGRAKLEFFRPLPKKDIEKFRVYVEADEGAEFLDFLRTQRSTFSWIRAETQPWFVEYHLQLSTGSIPKMERTEEPIELISPGPFWGEIDAFDLAADSWGGVFDSRRIYSEYIKTLNGIRVYRDGFAIRLDRDWLELGGQWTSATSYYGLKPDNTLGFIALTARENRTLEETTDREGFKDSPQYRNFRLILDRFVKFAGNAQEFFRRGWNKFREEKDAANVGLGREAKSTDLSDHLRDKVAKAATEIRKLETTATQLRNELKMPVGSTKARSGIEHAAANVRQVAERLETIDKLAETMQETAQSLKKTTQEELPQIHEVTTDQIDRMQLQIQDVYETVALGLMAEALSHEVFNIADQLSQRAKSIQQGLRNKKVSDFQLFGFVEHVLTTATALRKQVSFLSPALRYVKDQRQEFEIGEFVAELTEFYHDRLARNGIKMCVSKQERPFFVRMGRGKLTQVIDNLIQNSEYWLKEAMSQKKISSGTIAIDISKPYLRIHDNGSGIDLSVENALFVNPFVTTKGRSKGRGLGLFIAKQLLDSDGCDIALMPERNPDNRLFKFQIDLKGAVYE